MVQIQSNFKMNAGQFILSSLISRENLKSKRPTLRIALSPCYILQISNQILHYTRCITPKRETSLRGPPPRHAPAGNTLFSKKCRSVGEPLATLCSI